MSLQGDATLKDDLSYLKRLAENGSGRAAPMAALMAGFGLLCGAACLYQWWALARYFAAYDVASERLVGAGWVWVLVSGLFALLLLACVIQAFLRRGNSPAVNRVAAAGWAAVFLGLAAAIASTILQARLVDNYFAMNLLPSFLLVLWGIGWLVSGSATGQRWLYIVAACSFLAAPLWAVTSFFSINGFLVAGLCCLLLAFVPGVILMRRP